MKKHLYFVFILTLTACAAPQTPPLPLGEGGVRETPPPTETLAPSPVPTETLAPTSTPEATATPEALPEGLQQFVDSGGNIDKERGVAWNEEGLVMWAMDANGEWIEYNGIVKIPAGDGSGAPDLEVPIYADIESALWAITDELPWNEYGAYVYREKQAKASRAELDTYWIPSANFVDKWPADLQPTDGSAIKARVGLGTMQLPEGGYALRLHWASAATNYYFKKVVVFGDAQAIANQLLQYDPTVYIPSPDEVK